jgi:hypothetical protein
MLSGLSGIMLFATATEIDVEIILAVAECDIGDRVRAFQRTSILWDDMKREYGVNVIYAHLNEDKMVRAAELKDLIEEHHPVMNRETAAADPSWIVKGICTIGRNCNNLRQDFVAGIVRLTWRH